jgi:hypothetical protein
MPLDIATRRCPLSRPLPNRLNMPASRFSRSPHAFPDNLPKTRSPGSVHAAPAPRPAIGERIPHGAARFSLGGSAHGNTNHPQKAPVSAADTPLHSHLFAATRLQSRLFSPPSSPLVSGRRAVATGGRPILRHRRMPCFRRSCSSGKCDDFPGRGFEIGNTHVFDHEAWGGVPCGHSPVVLARTPA